MTNIYVNHKNYELLLRKQIPSQKLYIFILTQITVTKNISFYNQKQNHPKNNKLLSPIPTIGAKAMSFFYNNQKRCKNYEVLQPQQLS